MATNKRSGEQYRIIKIQNDDEKNESNLVCMRARQEELSEHNIHSKRRCKSHQLVKLNIYSWIMIYSLFGYINAFFLSLICCARVCVFSFFLFSFHSVFDLFTSVYFYGFIFGAPLPRLPFLYTYMHWKCWYFCDIRSQIVQFVLSFLHRQHLSQLESIIK